MLTLRIFAFMALIVGAFRLLDIRFTDLFRDFINKPQSIRTQIDEATNRKKKRFIVYEDLTKAGIALEFLIEGPVDDNFIEAYSFVLTRNSIWHIKRIRNIISPLDNLHKLLVLLRLGEVHLNYSPYSCVLSKMDEILQSLIK